MELESLPPLKTYRPIKGRENLLIRKIRLCREVVDFPTDRPGELRLNVKTAAIKEINKYISSKIGVLTIPVQKAIVNMFCCNVFRTLPPSQGAAGFAEEPTVQAAHPHLMMIYNFFLTFLDSPEMKPNSLRRYINTEFLLQLLELFNTEDSEERDVIPIVVNKIYDHFLDLRVHIRKMITNILCTFIYETEEHNGVKEILEFVLSIINEFFLQEEHKVFLLKVLVPLHKVQYIDEFHPLLSCAVVQFLEVDRDSTESVVHGLLKIWPKMNSRKEKLFLIEIEDILDEIPPEEFKKVMVPLFQQLNKCILSPNLQVAERALKLWNNNYILTLIKANVTTLLPILIECLQYQLSNSQLTFNSIKTRNISKLVDIAVTSFKEDEDLFAKCLQEYKLSKSLEKEKAKKRDELWNKIETLALKNVQAKEIALESDADLPPVIRQNTRSGGFRV